MKITIHNPAQLPVIDYRKIIPIQGDLKDLTETNYQKLKKSIEQNGFKIPAFVWKPAKNEEVIIDGAAVTITKGLLYNLDSHQRIRVLTKENATPHEIPYVLIHAENFQDAKKTLLLISSQYGTLTAEGFDNFSFDIDEKWIKEVLNFDSIDLLGDETKPSSEEDNYEIPENIATDIVRGDVFEIGTHRLMCGDCTNKDDVDKLMNGKKANFLLCDPPYGMFLQTDYSTMIGSIGSTNRANGTKGKVYEKVIGDHNDFKPALINAIFKNFKYCAEIFIFGADYFSELLVNRNKGSWLVWDKRKESQSDAFGSEFEMIWSKKKHKKRILRHDWFGFLSSQNTKQAQNRVHPTQKPLSLLKDIMTQWGTEKDNVVDLYGGSGSTMVAAHQMGRRCFICEIDAHYCQITIDRMIALDASIIIKKNGQPYIKTAGEKAIVKTKADVKKVRKPVNKLQTK